MNDYKQVILIRKDLGMGCGKACAQACHASQLAMWAAKKTASDAFDEWERAGYHKVILAANSEEELRAIYEGARVAGLPTYLIMDFGLTQLPPNTATAVGIGPAASEEIDKITGHLRLL